MFEEISLADAVEFIVDNRGKTVPVQETGFPLIATNCVSNENLYPEFNNVRYVSEEIYKNWFRAHPLPGDILLTNKGSKNGAICLVPEPVSFCIAQDMVALRANKDVVCPEYLFAVLRSRFIQNRIKELNVDSVIPHFKKTDFNKLFFPLPDYEKQIKIGGVHFSLCQKIELNRQTNQTLEQIAQAIFKSWFVDFEPVKAKIIARDKGGNKLAQELAAQAVICGAIDLKKLADLPEPYPPLEDQLHRLIIDRFPNEPGGLDYWQPQQLAATAALFPDALVDSELGEIPEGWEVVEARDQLDTLRGFSYKGKGLCGEGEGVPMHNLNSVLEGGGYKYAGIKRYNLEYKEKFKIQKGDVIVANTEQGHDHLLIGYGSLVPNFNSDGFFSHHLYRVRPKQNADVTPEFIEHLFKPGRFVKQVQGFTNGTTVNMLPVAGLEMPQFVCPTKKLAEKFSEQYKSKFDKKESNYLENIELQKLRDTLLPKLLSGEITPGAVQTTPKEVA